MKIKIVTPIVRVGEPSFNPQDYIERVRKLSGICPKTQLDMVRIEKGPTSIESRYDEVIANPSIMKKILEAEADGADAVVVNCFGDPGVKAGRELVKIPVVGPGEASMLLVASLCNRFSVVTILKNVLPLIEENAELYGISGKLASVRAINVPVLELHKSQQKTVKALAEEGRKAIEVDSAEALVLGCTGMTGMAEKVAKELDVFVVDPLPTALKFAETLVGLGLSQSKRAYPKPPEKKRVE